ncbi:MAG: RNA-binding cell elongation regulator Jag/EloR [Candidatus Krumholzibacteriota bacterium]|nr:RNA-binding cell elongation regulator Jag/EloR [Candidatus Krumholzibacteriota bacterium]
MKEKKDNGKKPSSVEATGKSVEKALKKALKIMGTSINNVEVEIENTGQKGILGVFGARNAKVHVRRKEDNTGVEEIAEEIARIILDCVGVNYRIFSDSIDDSTYINIETAGVDGLLIGRKGDTLNSLQHLVGRIVSKKMGGYRRITLDVGGYLKNRHDIIRKKAKKAAQRVKKTQKDVGLEPMKSSERRIAHIELTGQEGISTYTVGSGELRKVFVTLAGGGKKGKTPGRRS